MACFVLHWFRNLVRGELHRLRQCPCQEIKHGGVTQSVAMLQIDEDEQEGMDILEPPFRLRWPL